MSFSAALLVGAIVLVSVALSTALANQENQSNSINNFVTVSPGVASTPLAISSPGIVILSGPSSALDTESDAVPAVTPESGSEQDIVNDPQNLDSTKVPSRSPSSTPDAPHGTDGLAEGTLTPAAAPTTSPKNQGKPGDDSTNNEPIIAEDPASLPYDPFVTTFFVTGGRFTNDALEEVPEQLKNLTMALSRTLSMNLATTVTAQFLFLSLFFLLFLTVMSMNLSLFMMIAQRVNDYKDAMLDDPDNNQPHTKFLQGIQKSFEDIVKPCFHTAWKSSSSFQSGSSVQSKYKSSTKTIL